MGRGDLPSVYGLFNFIMGIGILVMPTITGSLVDFYGSYKAPFRFFATAQVCIIHVIHTVASNGSGSGSGGSGMIIDHFHMSSSYKAMEEKSCS